MMSQNKDENVENGNETLDSEDYPELNEEQVDELRAGRLPGVIKLHTITLLTSLLALVVAIVALIN